MKKKIRIFLYITIVVFFQTTRTFGQFPCGDHLNWDWTTSSSYTFAYIQGVGRIDISSPFNTESSSNQDLTNIILSRDYLPSQGWVLLDKVFGCPQQYSETAYPYFILYNKFRSIIRLFVFNNSGLQHQKALASLAWSGDYKTSLLTHQNIISLANDKYHPNILSDDKALNYVQDYHTSAWLVTDYLVAFDHLTDITATSNLGIKILSQIESNVKLTGNFEFTTKSGEISGPASNKSVETNQAYNYLQKGKKFISKVPSKSELNKHFNQINSAFDSLNWQSCQKLSSTLQLANSSLQNGKLKKFLLGIGSVADGIGGGLGIISSVFDIFIGKSNPNAIQSVQVQPTISNGSISLKGTISTSSNATQYTLQLPGTNHKRPDGSYIHNGLPIYDCPLGLVGLEKTPKLKKRHVRFYRGERCVAYNPHGGCIKEVPVYQNFISYLFTDDITIAINQSSNVNVISAKAQLVAHANKNIFWDDSHFIKNAVRKWLENGTYLLTGHDSSNSYRFATPMIDITHFKNTSLTVDPNTEIFLKLLLVLEPVEDNIEKTPIVFSMLYALDEFEETSGSNCYPFTYEQLTDKNENTIIIHNNNATQNHSAYYIKTTPNEDINIFPNGQDLTYLASESISFNSGIRIKPQNNTTFTAKINKNTTSHGGNALKINEYFQNCNCYPNVSNAYLNKSAHKDSIILLTNDSPELKLLTYPNPANNIINIQTGNTSSNVTANIYNAQGQLMTHVNLRGYSYQLDISTYPKGIYIVCARDKTHSTTSKFIKN